MKKLLQIKKTSLQAAYCLFFLMCCCVPNLQAQWTQVGATINGATNNEQFGNTIASSADGSIVAIGSNGEVRVFQNVAGSWTPLGATIIGASNTGFGKAISLTSNGLTMAISSTMGTSYGNYGNVRIYYYNGSSWTATGSLSDSENYNTGFGASVSLSADGTKIAVGCPNYGTAYNSNAGFDMPINKGRVKVFSYDSLFTSFNDLNAVLIDGESENDNFGSAVSLSANGSKLAVGAKGSNGNGWSNSAAQRGKVYVYQDSGWSYSQNGSVAGENDFDQLGTSIAISANGSRVIAGGNVTRVFNASSSLSKIGNDVLANGLPVAISADGSIVATATGNTDLTSVFQDVNNNWVILGNTHTGSSSVALSSNGSKLAVGNKYAAGGGTARGQVKMYSYTQTCTTPSVYTVSGGGTYCYNTGGTSVSLSNSQLGVNYQVQFNGQNEGNPVAGTGAALSLGYFTWDGTYTVVTTTATVGCTNSATMSGSATISTVNAPIAYAMTGTSGAICSGGTAIPMGLSTSQVGVTYTLKRSSITVGSPIVGTGGALSFGSHTTVGVYSIRGSNGACEITMTGTVAITAGTTPIAVTVYKTDCNYLGPLAIKLSGTQTGVSYQLKKGGVNFGNPIMGTGASIIVGNPNVNDTYTVVGTNAAGCTNTMNGSIVLNETFPTIYNVSGGGTYCSDVTTGFPIELSNTNAGFYYYLKLNGDDITGLYSTGGALSFPPQTTAGIYTIDAVYGSNYCRSLMSGSATITANPAPTVYTVSGGSPSNIIGLSNSEIGISYQLKLAGNDVGTALNGTGGAISFDTQTSAGTYTVVATNTTTGCTSVMSGNAVINGSNSAASILYVDANVAASGDGSSWANAFQTLSEALTTAWLYPNVESVHVAAGSYKPTKTPYNMNVDKTGTLVQYDANNTVLSTRHNTFHIRQGLEIFGGYPNGGGTRNYNTNTTILSGDIDLSGNNDAYHVVYMDSNPNWGNSNDASILDGFTIQGGSAAGYTNLQINNYTTYSNYGGGVYIYTGTNILNNNKINNNKAEYGAGLSIISGITTLNDNTISDNMTTGGSGAGLYAQSVTISANRCVFNNNNSSFTGGGADLINCTFNVKNATFSNNVGVFGGGFSASSTICNIDHSTFIQNSAAPNNGNGGAIYMTQCSNGNLNNNVFAENTASLGGGLHIATGLANLVENCTFVKNTATSNENNPFTKQGGGAYIYGAHTVSNCIFWENKIDQNTFSDGADIASNTGYGSTTVSNSMLQIQGYYYTISGGLQSTGTNQHQQNPLFVDIDNIAGADGIHRTADDGLYLQKNSPAINTSFSPPLSATDITGSSRVQYGIVDKGAYEYLHNCITLNTGVFPTQETYCDDYNLPTLLQLEGNTQLGVTYEFRRNGTNVGTFTNGFRSIGLYNTQNEPDFVYWLPGVYTVVATTGYGCSATMNGSIIYNPVLQHSVTGGGNTCTSTPIGLISTNAGVSYQLKKDGVNVGAPIISTWHTAISFGIQTAVGTYTIEATGIYGNCSATMLGSATITNCPMTSVLSGTQAKCVGIAVPIQVNIVGTAGPYTIVYSNGTTNTTVNNYASGSNIMVNPTIATTYTLVSVTAANNTTGSVSGSAIVSIDTAPAAFDLATVPANITLSCEDVIPAPATVLATSPCMTVTMTETSTKNVNPAVCAHYTYNITRTWKATNKQGNFTTARQVIAVKDLTAPTMTGVPASVTVNSSNIPAVATPIATDLCSAATITLTTTTITTAPAATAACYSHYEVITHSWKAADVCNRSVTQTQKVTVIDIPLSCPADKTMNNTTNFSYASATAVATENLIATAAGGCALTNLKYTLSGATTATIAGSGKVAKILNNGVTTVTYTLINANIATCSFNVTVRDNDAPKITGTAAVTIDACEFPATLPNTVVVTDNVDLAPTLSILSDVTANPTAACATKIATQKYTKQLTRTWLATDNVGNTSTATQIMYLRDMVVPTAVCKNITIVVPLASTSATLLASAIDNGSSDNCSSVLTYGVCRGAGCTTSAASVVLAKSLIPVGQTQVTIPVTLRVKDVCANQSQCDATVTLIKGTSLSNGNNSPNNPISNNEVADTDIAPTTPSTIDAAHGSLKCFPNPFSENLNLDYNLTHDVTSVTLKIYDNQGRLLSQNEQGRSAAGFYQMSWNLSDLQSGMYHVCLEIDGKCTKMERVIRMQ